MKKNSFTEAIYKNAGYIVVVLISIVYIASSLINISRSGKSIYEILGAGVLSLIVGIMINGVFRSVGLRRGDEDERSIATHQLHAKTVDEVTPYIDKLDLFCEAENKRALKTVRTRILAKEGLKYGDYFDEDGAAISTEFKSHSREDATEGGHVLHRPRKACPMEKAREKAYLKALRIKIKPLLASNLTSDGVKAEDPFDFGKSKREYTNGRNASDVIIKMLMAIIFGYFGVSLASDINVASIVWNSLQIVLYITGGVIQMYSSYNWVVDDYRGSIIKKIDYLQKFKLYAKEGVTVEQNNC